MHPSMRGGAYYFTGINTKNASMRQVLANGLRLLRFGLQLSQKDLAL
jgi:hypothetical protein